MVVFSGIKNFKKRNSMHPGGEKTKTISPQGTQRAQRRIKGSPQPKPLTKEATEEHGGKPRSIAHRRGRGERRDSQRKENKKARQQPDE
jgi:hypothetical protein